MQCYNNRIPRCVLVCKYRQIYFDSTQRSISRDYSISSTRICGKNSKPMLHKKLYKVVYRFFKNALLFYKRLTEDLIRIGFEIKKYNPCVANKKYTAHRLPLYNILII